MGNSDWCNSSSAIRQYASVGRLLIVIYVQRKLANLKLQRGLVEQLTTGANSVYQFRCITHRQIIFKGQEVDGVTPILNSRHERNPKSSALVQTKETNQFSLDRLFVSRHSFSRDPG
jgi:hypothetical protein